MLDECEENVREGRYIHYGAVSIEKGMMQATIWWAATALIGISPS
jgi:hypothetical protein